VSESRRPKFEEYESLQEVGVKKNKIWLKMRYSRNIRGCQFTGILMISSNYNSSVVKLFPQVVN
jgi:hypothetical protein